MNSPYVMLWYIWFEIELRKHTFRMLLRCCGINSYEHFLPQTFAFLYLWLELFIAISRAERRDAQSALLCRLGTFGANVAANRRPLYTPHSKGSRRLEIRQSAAWKKRFSDRDAKLNWASNRLENFVIWLMMLLARLTDVMIHSLCCLITSSITFHW